MPVVDLPVPPGFEVETSSLERLRERGTISRYEAAGRQVILYLEDVDEPRALGVVYRATQPVESRASILGPPSDGPRGLIAPRPNPIQ
ncbi:MAG: hypothetical protein V5A62_02445 [Haloarculaceae archaeon]